MGDGTEPQDPVRQVKDRGERWRYGLGRREWAHCRRRAGRRRGRGRFGKFTSDTLKSSECKDESVRGKRERYVGTQGRFRKFRDLLDGQVGVEPFERGTTGDPAVEFVGFDKRRSTDNINDKEDEPYDKVPEGRSGRRTVRDQSGSHSGEVSPGGSGWSCFMCMG